MISWSFVVLREIISHSRLGEPHSFGAGLGIIFVLVGGGLSMLFHQVLPWAWVVLGAAVLMMLLTWLAGEGRRADHRKQAELRRSGQHTTAVVTDQGYGAFEEGTQSIYTEVTVSFHDHLGTQRWVTRPTLISRHFPVTNGDTADLWFDPADPSATDRIVVDFG